MCAPLCLLTATSAAILKTESENNQVASLSGDNILGAGVRIGRGEDAAAGTGLVMDPAHPGTMKQSDYYSGELRLNIKTHLLK